MKRVAVVAVICLAMVVTLAFATGLMPGEALRIKTSPPQQVEVAFRLFETQNMWNFLLLDTRNGKVWQVQYSVNKNHRAAYFPINELKLPMPNKSAHRLGRFTLHPTDNMWNFILVDQDEGYVYQCQFSVDSIAANRFVKAIPYGGREIRSHNDIRTVR